MPVSFHIALQAGSLAILTGGLLISLPLTLLRVGVAHPPR